MCLSRIGQIVYGALALVSAGLVIASIFTPGWRQLKANILGSLNNNQLPVINMGLFQSFCTSMTQYGNQQLPSGVSNQQSYVYGQQYPNQFTNTGQQPQFQMGQNNGQFGQYGNVPYPNSISTTQNSAQQQQQQYSSSGGGVLDPCIQWWNNQPTWEKIVIAAMIIGLLATVVSFFWNLTTFCVCCSRGIIQKPLPALSGTAAVALVTGVLVYWYNNQSSIEQIQSLNQYTTIVFGQNPSTSDVSYSFYMACGAAAASIANVVVGTLIVCLAKTCL